MDLLCFLGCIDALQSYVSDFDRCLGKKQSSRFEVRPRLNTNRPDERAAAGTLGDPKCRASLNKA